MALLEDRERQQNDKMKELAAKLRAEQEEVLLNVVAYIHLFGEN